MRLRLWILVWLVLGAWPLQAQPDIWAAWLYDSATGRAVQVDARGVLLQDVVLPVPSIYEPATVRYAQGVAVSPDGTRLGYRVRGTDAAGLALTHVLIYETTTQRLSAQYQPPLVPLDDSFSFQEGVRAFNESGSALAYSYIAAADGATPDQWAVVVLDARSGSVLFELTDLAAAVQAQLGSEAASFLPIVQQYSGAAVQLSLFPYALQAATMLDSYQWDVLTGRIAPTAQYPTLSVDHAPATNETIMPLFDSRLPNRLDTAGALAIAQNNTLQVWTEAIGGRVPVFASADLDIRAAYFIENAERVVFAAFDLANAVPGTFWRIMERDGTVLTIPTISAVNERVMGTLDGFAYVRDGALAQLIEARTRDDRVDQVAVWTAPADFRPQLVWITPPTVMQAAPPAWAPRAEPVFPPVRAESQTVSPEEAATLEPLITGGGVLTINSVAIVNTTEGDRLNMRSAPGLSAPVIARVENRSRVTLLEGPRPQDGFIWWRVRLSTGLEGWVVQEADGVETLIPAN